jgi:hypothetical protein
MANRNTRKVSMDNRKQVKDALHRLCAAAPRPGLFCNYFSASRVAEAAGVSDATARKYLTELSQCLGYRRSRIHGTWGYRYDEKI